MSGSHVGYYSDFITKANNITTQHITSLIFHFVRYEYKINSNFFGPLENLHARFSCSIHANEIGINCGKMSLLAPKLSLPPF